MLPASFRWIDYPEGSYLHYNAKGVGSVKDREVTIRWGGHVVHGRCGSTAQGKRFVERWIAARIGIIRPPRTPSAD